MSINKKLLLTISTVIILASSVYVLVIPDNTSSIVTTQYVNPAVVSQYNVYMHPVGLPASSIWNVTVSGTTYTSFSDLISFSLRSGTYNFTAATQAVGISWDSAYNTFTVNDSSVNVSVYFTQNQFIGNTTVQSLPAGIAFNPYNDYMYVTNEGSGSVSVIDQSNVVIKNISVQSSLFGIVFDTFNSYMYVDKYGSNSVSIINQSNVVINNISVQCDPIGIALDPYNSYLYVTNFFSSTVSILSSTHDLTFYNVQFSENGLPAGTTWNISIAGRHFTSDSNVISVPLTPAEYTYSATNSNSSFLPVNGAFTVSSNMIINVQFQEKMYQVTFTETGLPSGTTWYLNLSNGQSFQSTTDKISFSETNGSYTYTVSSMEGSTYSSSLSSGKFTISGSTYSSSVIFSEITYQVTFTETGLPSGTTWYLNLSNGQFFQSTTDKISFSEPNGSYTYTVSSMEGSTYSSSLSSGTFKITGSPYSLPVTFSEVTYAVTFTETGLPSGTTWYIAIDNSSLITSSQPDKAIQLPNGTYYVTAISTGYSSNFTGTQTHAILTVSGSNIAVNLSFIKISSVVSSPSSSNDLFIAIGSAAGVIVGVAAGFFVFRKKN